MEWKELKDGLPTAPLVLFAGETELSLDGLGWGYQIGIFNNVINKYVGDRGVPLSLSTTGNKYQGYTYYLVPEPPIESAYYEASKEK